MKDLYFAPEPAIWGGRKSATKDYLHENIRPLDLRSGPDATPRRLPALLGYGCDEGVRRNLGRPGAAQGPLALRKALGKLPWLEQAPACLYDAGDIRLSDGRLEKAQREFAEGIAQLLHAGYLPLGIGGGHDIALAHYMGLKKFLPEGRNLGIVNFDAHFDLREPGDKPHSGSPFYQIAKSCEAEGERFRYACIGLRRDANPRILWDRAGSLGVFTVEREALATGRDPGLIREFEAFLEPLDAVYLTIDLDGFSSAYAPGVSAASPMGYSPSEMLPLLECVLQSGKVVAADIAELNPAHDRDGQTAALAASLFHRILHFPGLI